MTIFGIKYLGEVSHVIPPFPSIVPQGRQTHVHKSKRRVRGGFLTPPPPVTGFDRSKSLTFGPGLLSLEVHRDGDVGLRDLGRLLVALLDRLREHRVERAHEVLVLGARDELRSARQHRELKTADDLVMRTKVRASTHLQRPNRSLSCQHNVDDAVPILLRFSDLFVE